MPFLELAQSVKIERYGFLNWKFYQFHSSKIPFLKISFGMDYLVGNSLMPLGIV